MERRTILRTLLVCSLMVMVGMTGCGGDDDDDSPTTPTTPYSVTGRWEVARTSGWAYLVLNLTQTGQNITGTVERAALSGAGNDGGTITSGTNVNNVITITIQYDDMQNNVLTGTITNATTMGGTFTSFYPNETPSASEVWGAVLNNQ